LILTVNQLKFFHSPAPAFFDNIVTAHRFEQTINGRAYHIEAMLVDQERWRAYLVSVPGGPTALMPFYGSTAEEAVGRLTDWLTLAHQSSTISV
jgi:hypothetical protein